MSIIKNVCFLLVTLCISSFTNAQFPNLPFPFPFQPTPGGGIPGFPFPFPFGPSPGGMPRMPFPFPFGPSPGGGIPGLPFPFPFGPSPGGMPRMPFPFPFGPSPGGGIPGLPFPFPFGPSPGGAPRMPFPFPFGPSPGKQETPYMDKCWSAIMMDMPGCVAEIKQSIMNGKVGNVGPACCKVFLDAKANCAHNLPLDPVFPPMLNQCSKAAPSPSTL